MILAEQIISYRPQWYWQYFCRRFLADSWQYRLFPQHRWLFEQIKRLRPNSILEAGCGFGRNLNFLAEQGVDPKILTGADISGRLLKLCRLPQARLVRADVLHLPFADSRFDLVFTHGLLMHLKPRDLTAALAELVRVSKKYLILIEEVRPRPQKLNYFTWAHDYDKIIAGLPVEAVIKKQGKYSLIWYCLKKLSTFTPVRSIPKN